MTKKSALIAGASGLVGHELLKILLNSDSYSNVYALVRHPLDIQHPKLTELITDFENFDGLHQYFSVDDLYCCLGTTIKKAKTKESMYKVDVEYPVKLANIALNKGVNHFLVISSMNAKRDSLFWYPRMKASLEASLTGLGLASLSIFRPSLLLGKRDEFRLLEAGAGRLVVTISKVFSKKAISHLAIDANAVAFAMFLVAQEPTHKLKIFTSKDMLEFIDEKVR